MRLSSPAELVATIAAGGMVVVVDDPDRENEGDLIVAAEAVTPDQLAFIIRHTSGIVCVGMEGSRLDDLRLPSMVDHNTDRNQTAFTVSVDARYGVSTGISAADRCRTIHTLVAPAAGAHDLVRPGHVFPLRARDGGVLTRQGHTEAAVDLARLAGWAPAGVLAELVNDDGTVARLPEIARFAVQHQLPVGSIRDLVAHLRTLRTSADTAAVTRLVQTSLPTRHGTFTVVGFQSRPAGQDHLALVHGDLRGELVPLVRLHSECLTGDVLGSRRCDCGEQLDASMARIAREPVGALLYIRGHEGRGIGLLPKLAAYQLQDRGWDTVDANVGLGWPSDPRDYRAAVAILRELGVERLRLLTNNPAKAVTLARSGIDVVETVAVAVPANEHNRAYLAAKRERLGHTVRS